MLTGQPVQLSPAGGPKVVSRAKLSKKGRTISNLRGLEASMSRGPSIEAEKVQNSGSRSARGMMVLADLGNLALKKRVVNWQKQFQNSVLDSDNCSKTAC